MAEKEELYRPSLVGKWIGKTSAQVHELCQRCGVKPRLVPSPSTGTFYWVLNREQVLKLLVAHYGRKGERLMHGVVPKTVSE